MNTPNNASPDELTSEIPKPLLRRGIFIAVVSFLVFSFFATGASGAPEKSPPTAHYQARSNPSEAEAGSKAPVQTADRPKRGPSKRKAKPQARLPVSEKTKAKAEAVASEISSSLPESLEKRISKFYGLRYRMGGEGRDGIDCSGLVQKVYSDAFGIELPRSSSEQSRLNGLERVEEDELKAGDLLFFGSKRNRVNHVGMYLASGYFLHASRMEGVTISRLDDGYWKSRWIFSKRLKGLETEDDSSEAADLERTLDKYSAGFAFSGDTESDAFGFIEAGIQFSDSLEFRLSGFSMYALDSQPPPSSIAPADEGQSPQLEGGFRLSAVLSPSEWFKVIPSVIQIEGAEEEKSRGVSRQHLGLETRMILPSSRIALFMAARTENLEDMSERLLDFPPAWETLDVSLGLHYRLSDYFGFSLWGTHGGIQNIKEYEEPGRRYAPLDDVSFQLNVKF